MSSDFKAFELSIYRPALKRKVQSAHSFGTVPLRMPKIHALMFHVPKFVSLTGYRAKLGENGFEYFQHTCADIRCKHSHNLSSGGQLRNNLHYAWHRCVPTVTILKATSEQEAEKWIHNET